MSCPSIRLERKPTKPFQIEPGFAWKQNRASSDVWKPLSAEFVAVWEQTLTTF